MILAVVAAATAGWLFAGTGRPLARLGTRHAGVAKPQRRRRAPVLLAAVAAVLVVGLLGGSRSGVLTGAALLIAGTAVVLWGRHRSRRGRERVAADVAEGCAVLAREIRAGRAAAQAVQVVAHDHPVFAPVAATLRVGGSISESLRLTASRPGARGLLDLARAWEVSAHTGAALGPALDAVSSALRAGHTVARTTATELAAPRATGQLLGVLPLAGLVLGYLLGGNPLDFLINSTAGLICLSGGVGLTCAGLLWSDHLSGPT